MFAIGNFSFAQDGDFKIKRVLSASDTIKVDSLTIIPSSLSILSEVNNISKNDYYLDIQKGIIVWNKNKKPSGNLTIKYQTLPINLSKPYFHKDYSKLQNKPVGIHDPFIYQSNETEGFYGNDDLLKQGSVGRGIQFGNNQNLSVNSYLNLQVSGKITDDIKLAASISDENIPIQPEGNTAQIQDFDQVYIQVYDQNNKLTAGDFQLHSNDGYFMKYFKRAQGGTFKSHLINSKYDSLRAANFSEASVAISRGKFSRNIIQGIEGNQGPYRLKGAENENFIVVLAGTERVYIDGKLLKRGQQNEYTINYNTAELTFTAKQLITKDKRIIVEFQYSTQFYSRSIIQGSTYFQNKNSKFFFNLYSEQDLKSQTLQYDLSNQQKNILENVGDSLHLAVANSADTSVFLDNRVLYELKDSIINGRYYDTIYMHSTNQEIQLYKVVFSNVGFGNGNYVESTSLANGKVYEWVAPDSILGLPRGNYSPVILLVAPRKLQMATGGTEFSLGKNIDFKTELAISNEDINTFSNKNSSDNLGIALKSNIIYDSGKKGQRKNQVNTKTDIEVEFRDRNFETIERVRSVEFDRDWNIRGLTLSGNQTLLKGEVSIYKKNLFNTSLSVQSFDAGKGFSGLKNQHLLNVSTNKFKADVNTSYMSADINNLSSNFLRNKSLLRQNIGKIEIGLRDDFERNEYSADSLLANSYIFFEYELYAQTPQSEKKSIKVSATYRDNYAVKNNQLVKTTAGKAYGIESTLRSEKSNQIKTKITYRTLDILHQDLTINKPEETLLGRIEYNLRLWKGFITSNSFLEVGTGLEAKRDFTFIEVPAGQGAYTWNDFNKNGLKELDEFDIAQYSDQANYIKVFTPTNEYIKTANNQFSQVLNVMPSMLLKNQEGIQSIVKRFSNQFSYRLDRKTIQDNFFSNANPFASVDRLNDTSLISVNSGLRNTLFFNRTARWFSSDISYVQNNNKTLLSNGFESKKLIGYEVGNRIGITNVMTFYFDYKNQTKENISDFFKSRNYYILSNSFAPKISIQTNSKFRVSAFYEYKERKNKKLFQSDITIVEGGENIFSNKLGAEIKLNNPTKGSLLINGNYISLKYNGDANTPVAFELLEGLQNGNNITWSAIYQRTLANNLQLNIGYNGRKSETANAIHTGNVQVRAFF